MWDKINGGLQRLWYGVTLPDGQQMGYAPQNFGTVPGSRLPFSTNPTAADTVTIGGKGFSFVASLTAPGAAVQVLRGASAAASLTNVIDAINGKAATSGSTWLEATSAFSSSVFADAVTATQLRIRTATRRGGLPMAGVTSSTALAASITAGASAWTIANLNASGKSPQDCVQAYGQITITSAMITAGGIDIELEFQPTLQDVYVIDGTGLQRFITDTVTIPAGQQCLHFALPGGASPHVQAGDVVIWRAAS